MHSSKKFSSTETKRFNQFTDEIIFQRIRVFFSHASRDNRSNPRFFHRFLNAPPLSLSLESNGTFEDINEPSRLAGTIGPPTFSQRIPFIFSLSLFFSHRQIDDRLEKIVRHFIVPVGNSCGTSGYTSERQKVIENFNETRVPSAGCSLYRPNGNNNRDTRDV